jgi:hypothetical protein
MYNEIKEALFPYGVGQLISLLAAMAGFVMLIWVVKDIKRTAAEREVRNAKCREKIRNGYEFDPHTGYNGYEENYRIHDIR